MSRLDRQVILLETGSTSFIKNMAADQLSDLAKNHHENILTLIVKVYPFLYHKNWETRIAATRALNGILSYYEIWDPNKIIKEEEEQEQQNIKDEHDIHMDIKNEDINSISEFKYNLDSFDMISLLKNSKPFLAAAAATNNTPITTNTTSNTTNIKSEDSNPGKKTSSRMLAMQKRKQKKKIKSSSNSSSLTNPKSPFPSLNDKSIKSNSSIDNSKDNKKNTTTNNNNNGSTILNNSDPRYQSVFESIIYAIDNDNETDFNDESLKFNNEWIFQSIYNDLLNNLMNDNWEIRHGATLGLRDLLKKHTFSISRLKKLSSIENDNRNKLALEDLITRILIIFTLDRFGDYVYDSVVAPVRESAAQTLASLIVHLTNENNNLDLLFKIFDNLKKLILQNNQIIKSDTGERKIWEATHGGLLGLRYFVSIKTDFIIQNNLLSDIVNIVIFTLNQNDDDDLKNVATNILIPITDQLILLDEEKIDIILTTIWSNLSKLEDDLSSSIGSIMNLLSKLCEHDKILNFLKNKALNFPNDWSFKSLIPKLYPFLRHSISSVRKAVLNLLLTFTKLNDDLTTKNWINGKIFKLIFQNILFEQNDEILNLSFDLYENLLINFNSNEKTLDQILNKHLQPMLHLLNTPIGENGKNYNMDIQYILKPSSNYKLYQDNKRNFDSAISNEKITDIPIPESILNEHINIDLPMIYGDISILGPDIIYKTRILAAKTFGITLYHLQFQTLKSFFQNVLVRCLNLPFATPRLLCAIIMSTLCKKIRSSDKNNDELIDLISKDFGTLMYDQLSDPSKNLPSFREIIPWLKALRTQCQTLLSNFIEIGKLPKDVVPILPKLVQGEKDPSHQQLSFNVELAEQICNVEYNKLFDQISNSNKLVAQKPLLDLKNRVALNIEMVKISQNNRISSILSNYSSAYLLFSGLPTKLNPIIRSLMNSIKEEKNQILQEISGDSIVYLLQLLIENNKSGVLNKIIKNLANFLCVDTNEVPQFKENESYNNNILTLIKEQTNLAIQDNFSLQKITNEAHIKRKGAIYALMKIFTTYGDATFEKFDILKKIILGPLDQLDQLQKNNEINGVIGQNMVDALGILRALYPSMNSNFQETHILPYFPIILKFLISEFSVFRYSAARTLADAAKISSVSVMTFIIRNVLPLLNNASSVVDRQGAIELVYHMSLSMETHILPYVIFLIVPLLGRMSDSDPDVRSLATTTFASIIKLVPLEEGIADPEGLPSDLMQGRERERDFIQQMMDPSKAKPFQLPVAIKATLRKYQQDGVNWLAFLNKYHLHGILCDDMGLGKTLQTISIMASDQYLRQQEYEKTQSPEYRPIPSLIICPPSLTGHWEVEIEQYAPFLKIIVYAGGPSVRYPLRSQLGSADIIITSYDVTRNDSDILSKLNYNYCVLDEGHIIKNAQSKLAKAVKQIRANHRLILTGTPIQNNVVELWSLFDFLMPGFLGTEKAFQERFAKPIAASRNSRTSSKEQEAGALALEALHKQVLPFMLRRLKEDVLSDLPPKIIQDYYCELSDLQKQLYQDFAKKQKNVVEKDVENPAEIENKQHIFQALQYMRKLCNHPALVLAPNHPHIDQVNDYLKQAGVGLHDISNAPKLNALRTLLFECGIGEQDMDKKSSKNQLIGSENVISQHRALIFCQLKDMLDLIENDLFKKYMPSVTYMRLDGSVDPRDRQRVVKKYNEDPSIDCLLLTTKVGGLGLNLTGADTVIFVEHDWNPMNDLQAMDRAHRIGQKKVVNVYRIITKGTLEEKIMGLQKFKMNIASTVVNQQNTGLVSMDTRQLLDLFDTDNVPSQEAEEKQKSTNAQVEDIANETGLSGKAREALGELKELWDSSQYEEEYNLDNFIKTLR